jgi:hypothetical protein
MSRARAARPPISAMALLQQEVNELFQRLSILDRAEHLPGSEWSRRWTSSSCATAWWWSPRCRGWRPTR